MKTDALFSKIMRPIWLKYTLGVVVLFIYSFLIMALVSGATYTETFDNPNGFDSIINTKINGTATIPYSKGYDNTDNYSCSGVGVWCQFISFDGADPLAWSGATSLFNVADYSLVEGKFGNGLNTYNGSTQGWVQWEIDELTPAGTNMTFEAWVKFGDFANQNDNGNPFFSHHQNIEGYIYDDGLRFRKQNDWAVTYEDNYSTEWHKLKVIYRNTRGYQEIFYFVDGKLYSYNYDIDLITNTANFYFTLGGDYNTNDDVNVTFDSIRIKHYEPTDFPQNTSYTKDEYYNPAYNMLELPSIDTGFSNPLLNVSWTETLPNDATDIDVMFLYSDDNVTWTYPIPEPTLSLAMDNGFDTFQSLLIPELEPYGYKATISVYNVNADCSSANIANTSFYSSLYADGHDVGIEVTTLAGQKGTIDIYTGRLQGCVSVLNSLRPYFNGDSKEGTLYISKYYNTRINDVGAYVAQSYDAVNYFNTRTRAKSFQCDADDGDSACWNSRISEIAESKGWGVVTFHNITNTSLPADIIGKAIANNISVLSVRQAQEKYFLSNSTQNLINETYTKRYIKPIVMLWSGNGTDTPTMDDLSISYFNTSFSETPAAPDTTEPTVSITKNASSVTNTSHVLLTWNASDETALASSIFNVTYPNGSLLYSNTTTTGDHIITNTDTEGTYTVNLYGIDTSDNTATTSTTYSVTIPTEAAASVAVNNENIAGMRQTLSGIASWFSLLILTGLGVLIIILIRSFQSNTIEFDFDNLGQIIIYVLTAGIIVMIGIIILTKFVT